MGGVYPVFVLGIFKLRAMTRENPELKLLLGLAGAFTFVLSALKMPSVTGSSSHPTGTGLGAVMLGPLPMSVIGSIVLLFQALLLAHGGLQRSVPMRSRWRWRALLPDIPCIS